MEAAVNVENKLGLAAKHMHNVNAAIPDCRNEWQR